MSHEASKLVFFPLLRIANSFPPDEYAVVTRGWALARLSPCWLSFVRSSAMTMGDPFNCRRLEMTVSRTFLDTNFTMIVRPLFEAGLLLWMDGRPTRWHASMSSLLTLTFNFSLKSSIILSSQTSPLSSWIPNILKEFLLEYCSRSLHDFLEILHISLSLKFSSSSSVICFWFFKTSWLSLSLSI